MHTFAAQLENLCHYQVGFLLFSLWICEDFSVAMMPKDATQYNSIKLAIPKS
jgi:hypothetical protein